ncbi:50S ribosomal protein L28 [Streptomyces radiopugnans]|nr:50S ribosomal protein L28 [Streptomyces radiopugnans]
MAANCDVCGKGPGFGNNISHSHRRTSRRWNPNIQRVRAMVGRTPKRLNVCTSCIKAEARSRAERMTSPPPRGGGDPVSR